MPSGFMAGRQASAVFSYITDTAIRPPPTTGAYAYSPPYGSFTPDQAGFPALGTTYVDPVMGTTIRRITDTLASPTGMDLYGKNGWWNADGTYFVTTIPGSAVAAVHKITGAQKRLTNISQLSRVNASCSPSDADAFFYYNGTKIMRQSISGGTPTVGATPTTFKDFGVTLGELGGSFDWISGDGRYMLVNLGTDAAPSLRVWDSVNDVLFAGAVTDTSGAGGGWRAMVSDGSCIIGVGNPNKRSFAIDKVAQTLDTTGTAIATGTIGQTDHCCAISCSDGNSYLVFCNNDSSPVTLIRVQLNGAGKNTVSTFFTFPNTAGAYRRAQPDHFSAVSLGAYQDWCYFSSDMYARLGGDTDEFVATDPVATWDVMQNEIYRVKVITSNGVPAGTLHRLAQHRGRCSVSPPVYNNTQRISASWTGTDFAWSSDYGYRPSSGSPYNDIYTMNTP